jgi:EAL domain-containing protein (putative c-di-GMP-specific phosphodiesterase class I)/GGDEF domain-containing protein
LQQNARMSTKATDGNKRLDERRSTARSMPVSSACPLPGVVLNVSRDGIISSVVQAPKPGVTMVPDDLQGAHISCLWPGEVVDVIQKSIRQALRSRQVRRIEIRQSDDTCLYEMICVPQGRERTLVIFRNASELFDIGAKDGDDPDAGSALPARDFFMDTLERVMDLQRLREGRAALLYINISQLDDAGHVLGPGQQEDVLRLLGERLKGELRSANEDDYSDFSEVSIVARVDFRQFAVLLPSIETGDDAESVAERLLSVLRQPIAVSGHEMRVAAHAGIALYPQDGKDAATLYQSGFTAMEHASTSGSDPYSFHSGTVSLKSLQRQDLEIGIKVALDAEQFELNYLPIVDSRSRSVTAVEALLRWPDQMLASRSVRQVISIAERTGLIVQIGEWVLRNACRHVQRLRAGNGPELRLAINVSSQEFSRPDYVSRLAGLLNELAFDALDLDIEIQEHSLYRDAMKDYAVCAALKELGVGIFVDDFGTGVCSLAHLARSPIDGIKIDGTFVAGLQTSRGDQAACDGAITLARSLGIKSVAEGVETAEQAAYLQEAGCDLLQGFFLMKPMADDELDEFIDLTATRQMARLWLDD